MTTEYHNIFSSEREERALSRSKKADWHEIKIGTRDLTRKQQIILMLLLVLLATLIYPFVPTVGRAATITPKKDFPNTNAGTCMMIKEYGWKVGGAPSEQAVRDLCAKAGVQL